MPGLAAQQVGSVLPPWIVSAWPALLAAILVGVFVFLLWEGVVKSTHPAGRDRVVRWLVVLPTLGLLFMGIGAAVDAVQQSSLYATCLRAGYAYCQPEAPSFAVGAALWIGEGTALLVLAGLATPAERTGVFASRAFAAGCGAVLLANLLAFMVAGYFLLTGMFYTRAITIALVTDELVFVNTGLLVSGLLTLGGFQESDWGVASRLLAWMNLVPAGFLALALGMGLLGGGGLLFALAPPAFF